MVGYKMNDNIKKAILQLSKRAEGYDPRYLIETFVDLENLYVSLGTKDHQVIYGRRGTGKTHLLRVLKEKSKNCFGIYIDMRTIGSTGGVQNDYSIPLSERANRLILDVLGHIHTEILTYVYSDETADLGRWTIALDNFAKSVTELVVVGEKEIATKTEEEYSIHDQTDANIELGANGLVASIGAKAESTEARKAERTVNVKGNEICRIHFGRLRQDFKDICLLLGDKRLLILIDEWSEIPLDIQPALADLIKRTLLPTSGVTVKIAAIEKRSNFLIEAADRFGIEIGGDIPSTMDLDEYLVFDNSREKSMTFFGSLIVRHIRSIIEESGVKLTLSYQQIINDIFARADGFQEFVKATEGVPRDAINILTTCCQLSKEDKITIPDIRLAAKKWYSLGKEATLINKDARKLLRWIIDDVISHRRARAFLIESDVEDKLIDLLYDMRLIHIIKKGVSSNDRPGERFTVYAIDYGCYVDLINTAKEPIGLFEIEEAEEMKYIEVPGNDYRSIRRAILNLKSFYLSLT